MVGTQRAFSDRERTLVQRLGLSVAPLPIVEPSEVVEGDADIQMVGTQRPFRYGERALV
jgi:hypothetical protein